MLEERPQCRDSVYLYCKGGLDKAAMSVIKQEYKRLPVRMELEDVKKEDNSGTDSDK